MTYINFREGLPKNVELNMANEMKKPPDRSAPHCPPFVSSVSSLSSVSSVV